MKILVTLFAASLATSLVPLSVGEPQTDSECAGLVSSNRIAYKIGSSTYAFGDKTATQNLSIIPGSKGNFDFTVCNASKTVNKIHPVLELSGESAIKDGLLIDGKPAANVDFGEKKVPSGQSFKISTTWELPSDYEGGNGTPGQVKVVLNLKGAEADPKADYNQGFKDGKEKGVCSPGDRTGKALEEYNKGCEDGKKANNPDTTNDYNQGFQDGKNGACNPGNRTGKALEAYNKGCEAGKAGNTTDTTNDYNQGFQDGKNGACNPGSRTGKALDAYNSGCEAGKRSNQPSQTGDYNQGFNDGQNGTCNPGNREGQRLTDYNNGCTAGQKASRDKGFRDGYADARAGKPMRTGLTGEYAAGYQEGYAKAQSENAGSPYDKGYQDGLNGAAFNAEGYQGEDLEKYREGYEKGKAIRESLNGANKVPADNMNPLVKTGVNVISIGLLALSLIGLGAIALRRRNEGVLRGGVSSTR